MPVGTGCCFKQITKLNCSAYYFLFTHKPTTTNGGVPPLGTSIRISFQLAKDIPFIYLPIFNKRTAVLGSASYLCSIKKQKAPHSKNSQKPCKRLFYKAFLYNFTTKCQTLTYL